MELTQITELITQTLSTKGVTSKVSIDTTRDNQYIQIQVRIPAIPVGAGIPRLESEPSVYWVKSNSKEAIEITRRNYSLTLHKRGLEDVHEVYWVALAERMFEKWLGDEPNAKEYLRIVGNK